MREPDPVPQTKLNVVRDTKTNHHGNQLQHCVGGERGTKLVMRRVGGCSSVRVRRRRRRRRRSCRSWSCVLFRARQTATTCHANHAQMKLQGATNELQRLAYKLTCSNYELLLGYSVPLMLVGKNPTAVMMSL